MATYYVELNGGDIAPKTELVGGVITPSVSFSGAQIYPTSGGGGTVTLQTKSVTYTPSTSQQTDQVTPDQGYDGLDKVNVTVDAVASGSVAVNNKQVTFTSPFSFNAATGKITSSSLYQNPITATVTPGYVDSATDGELTVYLNKTQQLDTVGATTYYPSTSDQTIATQQYLTGAQTIKGVTYSGLDAGNIKKDVVVKIGDSADDDRIVSVTGTYEGGGGTDYLEAALANTLTSYSNSNLTSVREYGFKSVTALQTVSLPNVTALYNSAFESCSGLTSINLPKAATIGQSVFYACSQLTEVALPLASGTNAAAFRACTHLTTADFGANCSNLANQTFWQCSQLSTLILRRSSGLCNNGGGGTFASTPFDTGGAGGTIYIPEVLYNHLGDGTSLDYKAASNWSTVDQRVNITWAKIEGSYYETHYADGTVIS